MAELKKLRATKEAELADLNEQLENATEV